MPACLPAAEGAWVATQSQLLGIYAGVLVVHGLLNTFANQLLAWLNGVSVVWHVLGERGGGGGGAGQTRELWDG